MHCDWFHVFDLWAAAMVGSQELPVPRRCWSIWGLVVSLGNNSGLWQNNLVPTVTASFDVLEAGDMVEGCSIGFRFGFCGFGPVRNILHALAGFLDLLRRRF